jgi:hypothetical protein
MVHHQDPLHLGWGDHAVVVRAGRPQPPLVRWLAHSIIVLPPARHRVAEHGLVLISPPDECAIARGGGWCPAMICLWRGK